ncbi:MAG: DDE-type integrase/transposase/recombinase [Acidimicrobiales bacterium]
MTPAEIIYQRRIAVLDHAQRTGNVTEACRVFGLSRTRYYEWKKMADRYGLDALVPKARRAPQMPEATPTHVIEALLTLAVSVPTIGCRQYADRLGDQGFSIAKSTVQKHLVTHGLGRRSQRLARAAAIAAATTGLVVPDAERKDEPFGFCLATGGPGELVCLDSFYIGKLKGVGKVYQLTAIDVFTRFAVVAIVLGTPTGEVSARFIAQALRLYSRHGVKVRAILTDNGPEYIAGTFLDALAAKGIRHHRIPARSPNHNAVCERFQGTMLQECWRPAFHRRHFTSIRQLQGEADAWLLTYNHRRRNHGDYMRGRTPHEILDNHKRNKAA